MPSHGANVVLILTALAQEDQARILSVEKNLLNLGAQTTPAAFSNFLSQHSTA